MARHRHEEVSSRSRGQIELDNRVTRVGNSDLSDEVVQVDSGAIRAVEESEEL